MSLPRGLNHVNHLIRYQINGASTVITCGEPDANHHTDPQLLVRVDKLASRHLIASITVYMARRCVYLA